MAVRTYYVTEREAAAVLTLTAAAVAAMAFTWGMAVGTNDERLKAAAQQRAAIEACERDGDIAIRDVRSSAITCYSGRVAGK